MSKCRVSKHSFIFIWCPGKIAIINEKLIIGKDVQLFYGNFVGIPLCKQPEHIAPNIELPDYHSLCRLLALVYSQIQSSKLVFHIYKFKIS